MKVSPSKQSLNRRIPSQRELGSDAFSFYSNKFNLMKTLLMKDDDNDIQVLQSAQSHVGMTLQGPATKRRKGSNTQPVRIQDQDGGVRKTRISFEAHPSLILDDDILRMCDQMNSAHGEERESLLAGLAGWLK